MKAAAFALSSILSVTFTFAVASASETPYARTCRTAGGQAWSVNLTTGDDVTLCRFGSAAIGAADFAELKWNGRRSQSIQEFLSSTPASGGIEACETHGGGVQSAADSDGVTWQLCAFGDGSVVEAATLARGSTSASNVTLVRALR